MAEKRIVDGRGSFCPGPLMELIARLKMSQIGDELEVLSNDKGSANDIPEWVNKVGHESCVDDRRGRGLAYHGEQERNRG